MHPSRRRVWLGIASVPVALAIALGIAVFGWDYPVEQLDPTRRGPLLFEDRDGHLLRSVPAADGRRHAWVPLGELPAVAVAAVLASEDARFFQHPGVDVRALARAAWLDLRAGRLAFGGSTLTMQLVRLVEGVEKPRTLVRKLREGVLALRLERTMGKLAILEQYLNRAYYGHGAYGLDAAARTYFGKSAAALSEAEVLLLAVVPRAPNGYDPLRHLQRALARRDHVLGLLVANGQRTHAEVAELQAVALHPALHEAPFEAAHFVDWALVNLPAEVVQRGGVVRTSLDLALQRDLVHRLAEHVESLGNRGVGQAGVVVQDTASGEVLAMAGSVDYATEQLNITTRKRHPGSALKPFVYALAIEAGHSAASVALDILDVPSDYRVLRLAQAERGPVRYREALAGSYNLAAVHVLETVGIPRLMARLARAGVGPLPGTAADYGLRLALGSARVRLVDVAAAYGFLARGGKVTEPRAILDVRQADGSTWKPPQAREEALFTPETAWQVMDMLADPEARRPAFGEDLPLDLPFRVAAKTGTSRGFSDTVAIGVTSERTVAAWAGNFSGAPTQGQMAMQAAAPLVRAGLLLASRGRLLTLPAPPKTLTRVEVCGTSGLLPCPDCPHHRLEVFAPGHLPTQTCDWHGHAPDGTRTLAWPEVARHWAQRTGRSPEVSP